MRTIIILNPKGGCGKSTIATNIASYFAIKGKKVTLADCDPQGSSKDWLSVRPDRYSAINGIVVDDDRLKIPRNSEVLIIDTPAAVAVVFASTIIAFILQLSAIILLPCFISYYLSYHLDVNI